MSDGMSNCHHIGQLMSAVRAASRKLQDTIKEAQKGTRGLRVSGDEILETIDEGLGGIGYKVTAKEPKLSERERGRHRLKDVFFRGIGTWEDVYDEHLKNFVRKWLGESRTLTKDADRHGAGNCGNSERSSIPVSTPSQIGPAPPIQGDWSTLTVGDSVSVSSPQLAAAIADERAKMQTKLAEVEDKYRKRLAEAAIKLMATEEGKAKAEMRVLELEGKLTKAQEPLTEAQISDIYHAWLLPQPVEAIHVGQKQLIRLAAEAQRKKAL